MNLDFKKAFKQSTKTIVFDYLGEGYEFKIIPLPGYARAEIINKTTNGSPNEAEIAKIYLKNCIVSPEVTEEQAEEMIDYAYPLAFKLVREINTATKEFDEKTVIEAEEAEKN